MGENLVNKRRRQLRVLINELLLQPLLPPARPQTPKPQRAAVPPVEDNSLKRVPVEDNSLKRVQHGKGQRGHLSETLDRIQNNLTIGPTSTSAKW